MMADPRFAGYMNEFLTSTVLMPTFKAIRAREVNVLKEEDFPLLATWVESGGDSGEQVSDGEFADEVVYVVLVAARLGDDDPQDQSLGRLLKVVRDLADTISVISGDPVEFIPGDWTTDSNVETGDGDRVWASFPLTIKYRRPRGDY